MEAALGGPQFNPLAFALSLPLGAGVGEVGEGGDVGEVGEVGGELGWVGEKSAGAEEEVVRRPRFLEMNLLRIIDRHGRCRRSWGRKDV
jgi:hypothetical protein